jgi:hypothetical protein
MRELQTLIHKGSDRDELPGGVLLSFAGLLSKKSSEAMVGLTQNAVSQSGAPRAELLRAKSVVSDCLKCVLTHGLIDENGETLFYIVLESSEKGLTIQCGGFIDETLSSTLQDKVSEVNELSISDLRKKSVELLCKSDGLGGNNSGLSLINIALNCNRPIGFTVNKKGNSINVFSIDLIVNHALA